MSQLQTDYQQKHAPQLKQQLELANSHQVPSLSKVVINSGVGRAAQDSKHLEVINNTLTKITGQAPVATVAKHSIAGFKLREGQKIGAKVTLRGARMYEFLERLIRIVLPRTRDFRGLSPAAFDGTGNYSIGIADQSVFPELSFEDTSVVHGLQINLITTASDRDAAYELLKSLGLPFADKGDTRG
jgi:large subunit ribosomal protein L5